MLVNADRRQPQHVRQGVRGRQGLAFHGNEKGLRGRFELDWISVHTHALALLVFVGNHLFSVRLDILLNGPPSYCHRPLASHGQRSNRLSCAEHMLSGEKRLCGKATDCLLETMSVIVFLILGYHGMSCMATAFKTFYRYLKHQMNYPNAMNAQSPPPPPCGHLVGEP